jgi:hypothetical protein
MHRPLGRAWLVVYAPFSLAVPFGEAAHSLGFTASLAGPLAGRQCNGTIRLFVFAAFWVGAKCGKHFSVLNLAKIL